MDDRKPPCGFGWALDDEGYTDFSNQEDDKKTIRIWCTQCDVDMEEKGKALDCPNDGIFYVCLKCKFRIAVFEED